MGRASEAVIETVPVSEVVVHPTPEPKTFLPVSGRVLSKIVFALLVFGTPLFFGGVHPEVFSCCVILIALLGLYFLAALPSRVQACFELGSVSRAILLTLFGMLGFVCVQTLILRMLSSPHPVLASSSRIADWDGLTRGLLSLAFFTATFFAARVWLFTNTLSAQRLLGGIIASGFMVSLIALSHWFYDNGKLFWTFEPVHVFTSPRARWPFVNSNHLAHFLLPITLLLLAMMRKRFEDIREVFIRTPTHVKRSISSLLASRTIQKSSLALMFHLGFFWAAILAIAGSMSRGSWFGLGVALMLFAFRRRFLGAEQELPRLSSPAMASLDSDPHTGRRRRHRRSGTSSWNRAQMESVFNAIRRLSTPIVVVLAIGTFFFYLSGRGATLLESRLEYGLLYSHDDMRWQLYSDSIALIKDNLWLGVGLGGWVAEYPRYMTQLLSGVDPQYLHSEPLQLLAELGVLGFSIAAAAIVILFRSLMRAMRKGSREEQAILLGLSLGGAAIIIASAVDFPFRVPAISFFTATYLALASFYSDRSLSRPN